MDDNNFQSSLCITSMKQKLSGPTEAHGPFILVGILFPVGILFSVEFCLCVDVCMLVHRLHGDISWLGRFMMWGLFD